MALDGGFSLAADKSKRTRIYIRIEPGSPPEVVVDVTARAKKAGLTRVIVTDDSQRRLRRSLQA